MALLWKMICNLGDPMSLRHPVPPAFLAYVYAHLDIVVRPQKSVEVCQPSLR